MTDQPPRVIAAAAELVTPATGALVVYVNETLQQHGARLDGDGLHQLCAFVPWMLRGTPLIAAVFPCLSPGEYRLWWHEGEREETVTIRAGRVTQADWRDCWWGSRYDPVTRTAVPLGPGYAPSADRLPM